MHKLYITFIILIISLSCSDRTNPTESGPSSTLSTLQGSLSGTLPRMGFDYTVIEDIYVDSLNSLTIEPGARLLFLDSTRFIINGTINSVGNSNNYITYSSKNNSWLGIEVKNSSNQNKFQFCKIENVMVQDYSILEFGSLTISNSNVEVSNCIFSNNSTVNGGGISILNSEANITNNIFYNNDVVVFGGAIISIESESNIYNNTFYKNRSINYGGGLVLVNPIWDDIQNNIFYLNSGPTGDPRIAVWAGDSSHYNTEYNFLWYGDMNPLFISENDLHLKPNSPCINNGNPTNIFNDYDNTRNDQGAYGGPKGNW